MAASQRIAGRRVLLGVTGGIAAYKALDLIGRLQDEGAEVRVIMTASATKLIQPLTFQARSGKPVVTDLWQPAHSEAIEHIEYARWAELLLVAPLTANTMAKFAHGIADDPLTTMYLAFSGPTLIAPAMNTVMCEHPATRANLRIMQERGVEIVHPVVGRLACGEEGLGKLAPVEQIVEAAVLALTRSRELDGCRVLVTAGPTREHIDPVRYLSNPSSGKMGYALAAEAARRGAHVTLVSGPSPCAPPRGVEVRDVVTAQEMFEAVEAVEAERGGSDMLIFCAAVSDYRPATASREKIKKTGKAMELRLEPTKDIAFETSKRVRPGQLRVGFAAETGALRAEAERKLGGKKLDFIVANDVSDPAIGFGSDDNRALLIAADGSVTELDTQPKPQLARRLFDVFVPAWRAKRPSRAQK